MQKGVHPGLLWGHRVRLERERGRMYPGHHHPRVPL